MKSKNALNTSTQPLGETQSLFDAGYDLQQHSIEHFELSDNGHLYLVPRLFEESSEADALFYQCQNNLQWKEDRIKIHGKSIPIPRLQAWYGEPGTTYSYSGITLEPSPLPEELIKIRRQITQHLPVVEQDSPEQVLPSDAAVFFNSVLCNLYRDGNDSVSWHSDNEPTLGKNPIIASVSLGATRTFQLKHKKTKETFKLPLPHNSLLIMAGSLQHFWHHQIGKSKLVTDPRINLTFRKIIL